MLGDQDDVASPGRLELLRPRFGVPLLEAGLPLGPERLIGAFAVSLAMMPSDRAVGEAQ